MVEVRVGDWEGGGLRWRSKAVRGGERESCKTMREKERSEKYILFLQWRTFYGLSP